MSENKGTKPFQAEPNFKLGDLVDSFGCDNGRPYMPGTGRIIEIRPGEERPFICEHNGKTYSFNKREIQITDMY